MRMRYLSFGPAACLCGLAFITARATAAEPTARELIARAPVIRSDDSSIRTIALSGYSRNQQGRIDLAFRAFYKAPDRFAFVEFDGRDGTPITFSTGRELLVYDPVRPEIVVFHGVRGYRSIDVDEGEYHGVGGVEFASSKPESIVLDLKSLFAPEPDGEHPADVRLVKTGEQRYTLVSRHPKTYRRARIDLSRRQPFLTFELAQSPTAEPNFCIDAIVVDGDVSDDVFRFPALDRIPTGLTVKDTGPGTQLDSGQLGGAAVWARTFYVRTHLHEPALSRGFLSPAMMGVRWGRVRENDAIHAPAVRALVPVVAEHRDYDRPVKTDDPDAIRRTSLETIKAHLPSMPIKLKIKVH